MGSSFLQLPLPTAPSTLRQDQRRDAALGLLNTCTLPRLLDLDNRPIFMLNTDDYAKGSRIPIQPVFCNAALREREQLLEQIIGTPSSFHDSAGTGASHDEFRIWATNLRRFNDSRDLFPITIEFENWLWLGISIHPNWRLISGHTLFKDEDVSGGDQLCASAPRRQKETHTGDLPGDVAKALASAEAIPTREIIEDVQEPEFPFVVLGNDRDRNSSSSISSITLSTPDSSVPDWTVPHPRGVLSDHLQFVRSIDWAKTPLGAMSRWSIQFREIICLVMRNPHPSSVFWGEDLTMLYNEAYRDDVTGEKHPALMGTGFSGPFGEMWHAVGPVIRECARTGRAQLNHNQPLPIMRYGYMEEAFFTWSFVPVFGGTERILGFYLNAFDTTVESISARRMWLLRYLGECMNATRTVKEFWMRVLDGLNHNDYDVPFALLYTVTESEGAENASSHPDATSTATKCCVFEGSIGVPRGHAVSPDRLDLGDSDGFLTPAFRNATQTLEPMMLSIKDNTLPQPLLDVIEWRGYKDPCREAMVLPLRPTNADNVCALLLLGINPRRAYDQEYRSFMAMLNRQIATSLASVLLFEDEVCRSKQAAEIATLQREQMSRQLQLQTGRMRRMTELSPMGMYLFDPDGLLVEANDRYYEMTGVSSTGDKLPWSIDMMVGESKKAAQEMWDYMITHHKPVSRELQFANSACQPRDIDGARIEYWVMAASQPELSADGKLVSVMGSLTDISHLKWVQGLQERRIQEAEEAKRQQNEFIDITSHEMRNPLSAILICADDIRDTLTQYKFSCSSDQKMAKECVEAADNIALCVQHQKSIVDDVLTVSKLDSNLLRIAPIPAQPIIIAKNIDFKFIPHPSVRDLDIDWVILDPGRLLQIIVNLITNAIKFTMESQSPRTHMRYGGSGLGLFISRQLAELHGGQIGVSSKAGVGSIFGFYLKCKRMIAQKPTLSRDTFKHALEIEHAVTAREIKKATTSLISATTAAGKDGYSVDMDVPQSINEKIDEAKDDQLHILVVEDNLVNQKVLVKQLMKAGCVTSTADNGVWALKHLVKTRFCVTDGIPLDIILIDCEMPEMDGLTCCRKIRQMEQRKEVSKHIPIIAVTANIRGGQIDNARDAGVDDVVGKPFRIPDLLAKMRELLEKVED
ncbi:unnamed protein product [Alternaria sp. RS040]